MNKHNNKLITITYTRYSLKSSGCIFFIIITQSIETIATKIQSKIAYINLLTCLSLQLRLDDFYFVVQLVTFEFSAVALNKQSVNFSCDFFLLLLIRKTVNVNCNISVSLSILSCPDYFHRSHLPFSAAAVRLLYEKY